MSTYPPPLPSGLECLIGYKSLDSKSVGQRESLPPPKNGKSNSGHDRKQRVRCLTMPFPWNLGQVQKVFQNYENKVFAFPTEKKKAPRFNQKT